MGLKPESSLGPPDIISDPVSLRPCWFEDCRWGAPRGPSVAETELREPLKLGLGWGSLAYSEAPAPAQPGTHALH